MRNPAKLHPNAAAAGTAAGLPALIVTVLAAVGVTVPPAAAAWVVAAAPVVYLALKRKGIRGLVLQFWKGDEEVGA